MIFEIICDDVLFPENIESNNETYKTDFQIFEFIYDEVILAKLKVSKFNVMDIFQLGYQYVGYGQFKRQNGEIDG